ncbi:hypothetical protein AAG570_007197, partial [Ranatra chinensis]
KPYATESSFSVAVSSGGCSCHERWTCPGEHQPPLCPRKFLERYSLPRVVRVVPQQAGPGGAILSGDMSLLKLEARSHTRSRGSSLLVIPDTYQGWFSVVTERGQVKARCYSTIQRLVTARVTAFLVVNDTTAYTLNNRLNIGENRCFYRCIGSQYKVFYRFIKSAYSIQTTFIDARFVHPETCKTLRWR